MSEVMRKQFYELIISQLLFDKYEAEATAIRVFEDIEECPANEKLFDIVRPHLGLRDDKKQQQDTGANVARCENETEIVFELKARNHQKKEEDNKDDSRKEVQEDALYETALKTASGGENEKSPSKRVTRSGNKLLDGQKSGSVAAKRRQITTRVAQQRSMKGNKLKPTTCNICQELFNDSFSLYQHISEKHMSVTDSGCVCTICKKTMKDKYSLHAHLKIHSSVNHVLCPDCGEGFKRTTDYKDHRQKMHEKNTYSCPHCKNVYNLLRSLQKHISEVHKNPGRHVCSSCGKQFNSSNQLKMHEMVHHTREKPHKCKECGTSFRSSGHLQNHMLLHTGVKEFMCGLCFHRVYQKGNMKSHMKTHTSRSKNDVFWCADCKQGWPSEAEVDIHRKTCTGSQPKQTGEASTDLRSEHTVMIFPSEPDSTSQASRTKMLKRPSVRIVSHPKRIKREERNDLDDKERLTAQVLNVGIQSTVSSTPGSASTDVVNIMTDNKDNIVTAELVGSVQEGNISSHTQENGNDDAVLSETVETIVVGNNVIIDDSESAVVSQPLPHVVAAGTGVDATMRRFVINHDGKEVQFLASGVTSDEDIKQVVQQLMESGQILNK